MHSFITDADQRKEELREVIKTWVKIIRDTSQEVADIIDSFTYYSNKQRTWNRLKKAVNTNTYERNELRFQRGFRKLKSSSLLDFPRLIKIVIERGAMPETSGA